MITVKHEWATPVVVRSLLKKFNQRPVYDRYWLSNKCCYLNLKLDDNGSVIKKEEQHQDACHARLRSAEHGYGFTVLYFNYAPAVTHEGNVYHMNIADILLYIDWMANESPFAGIFISKNPSEIYELGALIDTSAHYGLAFAAAIASRFYYEHGREFVSWLHMVKAGVDKNAAYAIALAFKAHCKEGKGIPEFAMPSDQLMIAGSYVNHGGVDSFGWDEKSFKNWMSARPSQKTKTLRQADASFKEAKGEWLTEAFKECPAFNKAGGRFGGAGVNYYEMDVFIAYVKEVVEPRLLAMANKKVVLVKPVVINKDEPEKDL